MNAPVRRRVIAIPSSLVGGALALAACVAVSDPTAQPSRPTGPLAFSIETFTPDDLAAAGFDQAGCWFHSAADPSESLMYGGTRPLSEVDVAYLKIDGQPVTFTRGEGAETVDSTIVTAFTSKSYDVALEDLGEPVTTSIESNERDAVLVVTSQDGDQVNVSGVLWCGV